MSDTHDAAGKRNGSRAGKVPEGTAIIQDSCIQAPAATAHESHRRNQYVLVGNVFRIRYQDCETLQKNSVGNRYVSHLLGHPLEEYAPLRLVGIAHRALSVRSLAHRSEYDTVSPDGRIEKGPYEERLSDDLGIDRPGKEVYKKWLEEMAAEIAKLREDNDTLELDEATKRFETMNKEYHANFNRSGRPRRLTKGDPIENARSAVCHALRRAYARIGAAGGVFLELEEYLRTHIRYQWGTYRYVPDPNDVPWETTIAGQEA